MEAFRPGENYQFKVGSKAYLFSVANVAIAELGAVAGDLLEYLEEKEVTSREDIFKSLGGRYPEEELNSALEELKSVGGVVFGGHPSSLKGGNILPPLPFPIRMVVLNIANQCNLSCKYCYAKGGTYGGPMRLMSQEIAHKSIDFLLANCGNTKKVAAAFFGGEALFNFKVMKSTVDYGKKQAAKLGKNIEFTVTTNGTLLSPELIDYFSNNQIGVMVSIDGPKEINDRMRIFPDGRGCYDFVSSKISRLIKNHKTRPVGARATLTKGSLEVKKILLHLLGLGFYEVGLAPVTSAPGEEYSLSDYDLSIVISEFKDLAKLYVEQIENGRYLGFSNLTSLLEQLHNGVAKPYPCGAGLALVAISTTGEIYVCHRLLGSGSEEHLLGHIDQGIDPDKQEKFLKQAHLSKKDECLDCWVRNVCAGGCYQESYIRYGDSFHGNTHYCNWIRRWYDLGLRVYVDIMDKKPNFIEQFSGRRYCNETLETIK